MTSRYRFKNNLTPVLGGQEIIDAGCSTGTTGSPTNLGTVAWNGKFWDMTDVVTPGFARKSSLGVIINNPLTKNYESHTSSGSHWRMHMSSNSCTTPIKHLTHNYSGPCSGLWLPTTLVSGGKAVAWNVCTEADVSAAVSVANTAAWAASRQANADVLQDIAEIRQALSMIRDPLQRGHRFLDNLLSKRKWRHLNVRDAASYASSQWLQYRFGIRPLVSTISGVLASVGADRTPKRLTSRGSFDISAVSTLTGTCTPSTAMIFDYRFQYMDDVKIRTGVLTEEIVTLPQQLGCDASGMLALPWELVPYSFVVDWFGNVGTYLHAVIPALTKRPLSTWTTITRRRSVVFDTNNCRPGAGSTWILDRAATTILSSTYETITRKPVLGGPSLTYKPQSIDAVLNDLRTLDSLALFINKLDRVFKH